MSQAVFLVLTLLGEPTGQERALLAAYARARQVEHAAPAPAPALAAGHDAYDVGLASEIETSLERARTAAASLDETAASELLELVSRRLREHPELPQSAWLMAERYRVGAALAARAGNK